MDSRQSVQNVLRCDICKTAPLQSHCKLCNINLCVNCVGRHLSDSSKDHNVVPFLRRSTPKYQKCPKHAGKRCELYCEKCDKPVCNNCVSSDRHRGHKISDVLDKFGFETDKIQKDLEDLEARIYPRYEKLVSDVENETSEVDKNYRKLTKAADQHGEALHQEVTAIVNQRKSDIAEMKSKHMAALKQNTDEITNRITELKQIILDLKTILNSNDVSLTSAYKSTNSEFRTLPPKVRVTLPSFSPQKINKDQLNEMFGSLSSLSITKKHRGRMKSPDAVQSPPVIPLLDEPLFTANIDTKHDQYKLSSVSCLSEEQVWTCGNNKIMKLLNLQGEVLESKQTKSGNWPRDIAVTRDGELVYTDPDDKTVNLVKKKKIWTVITLNGWVPLYICITDSDDLLVTMISNDLKESKVVRYSGSTETQTIQFDDHGRPLYSSGHFIYKYISENKNLDICVADRPASAVVVVNQSGKLRFRYTGHPSNTEESLDPAGITTDSQSHILIADCAHSRIHIIDQDGRFLRYIQNSTLRDPWALSVDIKDNLFVTNNANEVKKIQYL